MDPVTAAVPHAAGDTSGGQCRRRETGLLGQLAPRRRFWHLAVPNAATGQMPPPTIRGAYQQQRRPDINRHHGTLMPRARQPPPDAGNRKTDAETCPPGVVEK